MFPIWLTISVLERLGSAPLVPQRPFVAGLGFENGRLGGPNSFRQRSQQAGRVWVRGQAEDPGGAAGRGLQSGLRQFAFPTRQVDPARKRFGFSL
jgi:hypothetical protein